MIPRLFLAGLLSLLAGTAWADKVPLTDDELGQVSGKGIAILVQLELNAGLLTGQTIDSRINAGFAVNGTTTYAIAQNFGGILDLFAVTLDPATTAGGTSYLAIGMPNFVGAQSFGIRAVGVQTDPNAAITSSLGSFLLNGTASMTGQLNLWAK